VVKIDFTSRFNSMYSAVLEKKPELKEEVFKRVNWFRRRPDDQRLDNHALRKRMNGKWAFSITDDIRIVYEWKTKNVVRFLAIGGHKKVYGRKGKN
jgi:mRNA-degrading endonuclease YafQ of YafQ-DinJ toxin-antitoxin module